MAFAYDWLKRDKSSSKNCKPGFVYKIDDPAGYSKIGGAAKGAYSRHGGTITMNPLMVFDCEWFFLDWQLAEWEARRRLIDAGFPQVVSWNSTSGEGSECHAGDPDSIFDVIEGFYQEVSTSDGWSALVERESRMANIRKRRMKLYQEYLEAHGQFPDKVTRQELVAAHGLQYIRSTKPKHAPVRLGQQPPHRHGGGGYRRNYNQTLHTERFWQWNKYRQGK